MNTHHQTNTIKNLVQEIENNGINGLIIVCRSNVFTLYIMVIFMSVAPFFRTIYLNQSE